MRTFPKRKKLVERVKRCRYCHREMKVSALSYLENPFCKFCLRERIEKAATERGPIEWVSDGHYMRPVPKKDLT